MNEYFKSQIEKKNKEIQKWSIISLAWFVFVFLGFWVLMVTLPRPADSSLPWWLFLFAPICLLPLIVVVKKVMEKEKIIKKFCKTNPQEWREFVEKQRTLR